MNTTMQDRRAGTLLVAMSAATLPHLLTPVAWLIPVFFGVGIWRLAAERGKLRLPNTWQRNLLGISLLVLQGLIMLQYGATLAVATAMLVGFTWIKMLEVRSLLDDQVLCLLCILLIASYMLVHTSLWAALYAGLAASVGLVALQRCADREAWRMPWRLSIRLTYRLVLVSLPLSTLVFLLLPRFPVPVNMNTAQTRTGVDDDLRPGAIAELIEDEGRAFTVSFPDGRVPPRSQWYWRGAVCWEAKADLAWETGSWLQFQRVNELHNVPSGPNIYEQSIMLEPHQRKLLFSLDHPTDTVPGFYMRAGYDIRSRHEIRRRVQYQVRSRIDAGLPPLADPEPWGLQVPANIDPAVHTLADTWRGSGDARAIMQTGLRWFQSGGFRYTRSPGDQGDDPLSHFLFTSRQGFCEHYAASYALLMRMAGVPARVVVGYRGGNWNPYGDFIEVQFKHAHAWCEVYLAEEGWVRVDPTISQNNDQQNLDPATALLGDDGPPAPDAPWLEHLHYEFELLLGWVDFYWYQFVVGYDDIYQQMLLATLGLSRFGWWAWPLLAIGVGGPLLLFGWWLSRRWRRHDPMASLIHQIGMSLQVPRQPSEPVRTWAARVAEQHPACREPLQHFIDEWCRMRYGPGQAPDLRRLRALKRQLHGAA